MQLHQMGWAEHVFVSNTREVKRVVVLGNGVDSGGFGAGEFHEGMADLRRNEAHAVDIAHEIVGFVLFISVDVFVNHFRSHVLRSACCL